MLGWLVWLWLVIRTAFRHAVGLAETVVFLLGAAATAIVFFIPEVKPMIHFSEGQIALTVLSAIVAARLILAPYWIYQEQQAKLARQAQTLKRKATKREIRERIAGFMDEGRAILLTITQYRTIPDAVMKEWDKRTKEWLVENLDTSYKTIFATALTHPEPPVEMAGSIRMAWIGVRFRIDNLGRIMEEFK